MQDNLKQIPQVVLLFGGKFSLRLDKVAGYIKQLLPDIQYSSQDLLTTFHPDVLILPQVENKEKLDSIKIDDVRRAISHLRHSSHQGGNKIVVLLNVDYMSLEASNGLLKIAEEPLPNSFLFLLCQYPYLLPVTLRSRCWKVALPYEQNVSKKLLQDIETSLKFIKNGKLNVIQASEKFQSMDLLEVLDGLYYFCLSYLCSTSFNKKLFRWVDVINQTRMQVLNKQNPNRQLSLENIFYHWKTFS